MTLRGRKVRLDHAVRIAAYCGTMREFQKLVLNGAEINITRERPSMRHRLCNFAGFHRSSSAS